MDQDSFIEVFVKSTSGSISARYGEATRCDPVTNETDALDAARGIVEWAEGLLAKEEHAVWIHFRLDNRYAKDQTIKHDPTDPETAEYTYLGIAGRPLQEVEVTLEQEMYITYRVKNVYSSEQASALVNMGEFSHITDVTCKSTDVSSTAVVEPEVEPEDSKRSHVITDLLAEMLEGYSNHCATEEWKLETIREYLALRQEASNYKNRAKT